MMCPVCSRVLKVDANFAGQTILCPCGQMNKVSAETASPTIDKNLLMDEVGEAIQLEATSLEPVQVSNHPRQQAAVENPASLRSRSPKRRKKKRVPHWAIYMVVGAAFSPVLTLTPFLQYLAWILSSIIHEAGHTLFAWFVGRPALPAINLTGHAMTTYSEQRLFICLIVWLLLALVAVEAWRQRTLFWPALAVLLLYPVVAFVPVVRELGALLSGHGGELLVGGIFLWQARTCLFVHDQMDRMAYAVVGWYLIFANAWLCLALVFVPGVLAWYRTSGSYQLMNDYLRASEQVLHVPLVVVVLPMFLAAVCVPPAVLLAAKYTRGADG